MRETYKRERKQNGRGREKADRKGREYRGTKVRATTSSSGKSAGRMEQEGIKEREIVRRKAVPVAVRKDEIKAHRA